MSRRKFYEVRFFSPDMSLSGLKICKSDKQLSDRVFIKIAGKAIVWPQFQPAKIYSELGVHPEKQMSDGIFQTNKCLENFSASVSDVNCHVGLLYIPENPKMTNDNFQH